jgi:diadenosine tetraphosphate (Ap4A) HIT family hydrolase
MRCAICQRLDGVSVDAAFVAELGETFVVLGDNQGLAGWCVLLLKEHVEHLAELPMARQGRVFEDVARVAAAIRRVYPRSGRGGGTPRINYECLGNLVPHVHWHVIPRHADDPEPTKAVWGWAEDRLRGSMTEQERGELVVRLREALGSEVG